MNDNDLNLQSNESRNDIDIEAECAIEPIDFVRLLVDMKDLCADFQTVDSIITAGDFSFDLAKKLKSISKDIDMFRYVLKEAQLKLAYHLYGKSMSRVKDMLDYVDRYTNGRYSDDPERNAFIMDHEDEFKAFKQEYEKNHKDSPKDE